MATGVERAEPPLVVIVGPTASGKTALAIELAKRYKGEIICADSRTVYRGMDIGTAKPSAEERAEVPHWGLDLAEPGERFTAADFQHYARKKIQEIRVRGHVPFLVGGTGLYVDGVIFDYQFGAGYDPAHRAMLESKSVEDLQEYCRKYNVLLPRNERNRRHLIRAIEQKSINNKRRNVPIENTIVVGIATNSTMLRTRIRHRSEQMLRSGVVEEAIILGEKYGWKNEAMTGNIYPLVKNYLEGDIAASQIEDKITTLDWHLAKRQLTWLRRNPYIYWGKSEQIREYVIAVLEPLDVIE